MDKGNKTDCQRKNAAIWTIRKDFHSSVCQSAKSDNPAFGFFISMGQTEFLNCRKSNARKHKSSELGVFIEG